LHPHLVIGAGAVGQQVAQQLADSGREVVVVSRRGAGPVHDLIRLTAADATSVEALLSVAPRAEAIYNCANPAYHRWVQDWPPLASAFLAYAEQTGAVLVTCSNLYGYGPVEGPVTEGLPLASRGVKGQVRAQMWQQAKAQHDAGKLRATEVRGSDYIVAAESSLIASSRVVPRILRGRSVSLLGNVDVDHSWTAPVDVARLMVAAAVNERAWGLAWHVPTNPPRTQRQVVNDLADQAERPHVPVKSLPTATLWALGLFSPAIRELRETDYQRATPFVIDDTAARQTFGIEPTPWPQILESVLNSYRDEPR